MTLIKEDGTGLANANSYANAADGDTYHDGRLYASAWTGASDDDKAKALVMATRIIDAQYQFNGSKTSRTQALQWPRTRCPDPDVATCISGAANVACNIVPTAVTNAVCEMARELLIVDRTASPAGEGILSIQSSESSSTNDGTTSSSAGNSSSTTYSKTDTRPIISRLTQSMLAKYGRLLNQTSGPVRLIRT